MLETVLANAFLLALDKLLKDKIGNDEKQAVSSTLARLALHYAQGKSINVDDLKPVDEMKLEDLLKNR
jgi:hypothetical protein